MKRLFYVACCVPCCECGEVSVLFWKRRCSFCDIGEGRVR